MNNNNTGKNKSYISKSVRFSVLERDSFRCRYCGAGPDNAELHIDHVVPVSVGGGNDMENLVTACANCNLGKSDLLLSMGAPPFMDPMIIEIVAFKIRKAIRLLEEGNSSEAYQAILSAATHLPDIGWPDSVRNYVPPVVSRTGLNRGFGG